MAKAKITKKDGYRCAPKGSIVETFPFGAIVDGQVADWACADHAAQRMLEKKRKPKLEDKSLTPKLKDKGAKKWQK